LCGLVSLAPVERLWDEQGPTGLSLVVVVEKVKLVEQAAQATEKTQVGEKM
jgi:hypothetical protein